MGRNQFTPEQEKWLQALESGEWKQAKGQLHDGDRHCCLGVADVACDLREHDALNLFSTRDRMHLMSPNGAFRRDENRNIIPVIINGSRYTSLTAMNDGCEAADGALPSLSFAQIAAFIRAHPWQVFTNFDAPQET